LTESQAIPPERAARARPRRRLLALLGGVLAAGAGSFLLEALGFDLPLAVLLSISIVGYTAAWEAWGFRSLKTGLTLLAIIGAFCVFGTMRYAANSTLGEHAIPLARARVFNAWWFFAFMGLFAVQFAVSTWPVTRMSLRTWGRRDFRRSASFYAAGRGRGAVRLPGGPDGVEAVLAKRFTRVHRDGDAFFAHRGLRTRWGPTIVHAGIVVILLAGLARILLDRQGLILSDGRFVGVEGETLSQIEVPRRRDQAASGANLIPKPISHDITVLDFDEIRHPNSSSPAYFSTLLRVRDQETGRVRVAKLDMNHSLRIGSYEFHQAGYQPLPPIETWRTLFDVRDLRTGERLAATDASPGVRVQVGDLDLFLEVDGEAPGDPWRLYGPEDPANPVAEGVLLAPPGEREFSVRATEFFPDFRVRESDDGQLEPYNASDQPLNPAARVEFIEDGLPTGQTVLFLDPRLAGRVGPQHPRFAVSLEDIEVARPLDKMDWSRTDDFRLVVRIDDAATSAAIRRAALAIGAETEPVRWETGPAEPPPPGARYAVLPLGRELRYATILSVVREPVVPYYIAGVVLIAFGAFLTFAGRYEAFYALWDSGSRELKTALVPRFGRDPDPRELERLTADLARAGANPAAASEPAA